MTKVIAEIGSNFTPGDLNSAKKMIQTAAECGADVAKFQILDTPNINRPQWWKDKCKPWDIPEKWCNELASEALRTGVGLLFSVFTVNKATYYASSGKIKVASSELGNQALLYAINNMAAGTTVFNNSVRFAQVYMSIPPDKHPALIPALTWLNNCHITLMHCVPEYPVDNPHLECIVELLKLGLPVGWSSHVAYPAAIDVARMAVSLGATVVEAHLRDFDTPEDAPDNKDHSLYPGEFAELVKEVKR